MHFLPSFIQRCQCGLQASFSTLSQCLHRCTSSELENRCPLNKFFVLGNRSETQAAHPHTWPPELWPNRLNGWDWKKGYELCNRGLLAARPGPSPLNEPSPLDF
ncbi:hypothetical protein AVEN_136954-1 [Araneus ventricosus]|uniref:Uncharacterized protein n=1 Tax=Araneus ventricosus TaxID=182803 RepID=A0A4Y2BJZ7_ARAVE|nr:hypothetical protein AVEN_136954-1 [Araneus ventricosus]